MKKILVAPLDWGLGHATRCIPIIEKLLERNCIVCLAGSGPSLQILRNEFPQLQYFSLAAYNPVYPENGRWMVAKMALQIPTFVAAITLEKNQIDKLVSEHQFDIVISDNRYGCWSKKAYSVFISHQLNIQLPKAFNWLSRIVAAWNRKLVNRFDECWIPDDPQLKLSGLLSNSDYRLKNEHFIGILSRFTTDMTSTKKYDVLVILSGPEPQRTILENILMPQLNECKLKFYLVRGQPGAGRSSRENISDMSNSKTLNDLIESSSIVISRSGYSSIMDMAVLNKKVIFIPTPGQTEQEYLAEKLERQGIAFYMHQNDFDLNRALEESKKYRGFVNIVGSNSLLGNVIDQLLANPKLKKK